MRGLEGENGNKNAVLNYTFILKKKKNTWCQEVWLGKLSFFQLLETTVFKERLREKTKSLNG